MRRSSWSVAEEVVGNAHVEVRRRVPVLSCMLSCE